MTHFTGLIKIGLIYMLMSYMISGSMSAQHTVYPDLIILGSDSIEEGGVNILNDTSVIFDISKGGFSGGVKIGGGLYTWYRDSIGLSSFSYGYNTLASGDDGAVALGIRTEATGRRGATALGVGTRAAGDDGATAMGSSTKATGRRGATALGADTRAAGDNGATALGDGTEAYGSDGATAMGDDSEAHGNDGAIAMGQDAFSMGNEGAIAMGKWTRAHANSGTVVGQFNDTIVQIAYDAIDKPLFIVGNGTGQLTRTNAMVVRQDGLTTIQKDLVVGAHALPPATAIGDSLFIFDKSKGAVIGGYVTASFGASWAPDSIGVGSVALGVNPKAIGKNSVAIGARPTAYGDEGATALGFLTIANADRGLVVGSFNDPVVSRGYDELDKPLFIIGNGEIGLGRSNAMVVRQDGSVGIGTDATSGQLSIKQRSGSDNEGLRLISSSNNRSWEIRHTSSGDNLRFRAFADDGSTDHTVEIRRSDGAYLQNSDMRLKKDISPLTHQLEKVVSLAPSTYRWKDHVDPSNPSIGVIAQEVEELFPYLVHTNEDGYKMVNYDGLGVLAIQAIKEQQEIIDRQYRMLQEFKQTYDAAINELESKLIKLEGKNQ